MILHISIRLIGILFPIHRNPLCTSMGSCLTPSMLLGLFPNYNKFNIFIKPDRMNPATHCSGSNVFTPLSGWCICFKYMSSVKCTYFFLSLISYQENFSCGIFPRVSLVNDTNSNNKGVKFPYFTSFKIFTSFLSIFLGGIYGGRGNKIVVPSIFICTCSTSSSLSLPCLVSF